MCKGINDPNEEEGSKRTTSRQDLNAQRGTAEQGANFTHVQCNYAPFVSAVALICYKRSTNIYKAGGSVLGDAPARLCALLFSKDDFQLGPPRKIIAAEDLSCCYWCCSSCSMNQSWSCGTGC